MNILRECFKPPTKGIPQQPAQVFSRSLKVILRKSKLAAVRRQAYNGSAGAERGMYMSKWAVVFAISGTAVLG
ncbi:MAG: hypothetical protein ACREI9_08625, partial [Nitrospiraceae bacterium]